MLLFVGTGTSSGDVAAVKNMLGTLKITYATATSTQLNGMSVSALTKYKLLLVPGGNEFADRKYLSSTAKTNVRTAIVNNGLHYLGICAGAFFAGHSGVYHYLNSHTYRCLVQLLRR